MELHHGALAQTQFHFCKLSKKIDFILGIGTKQLMAN